jgi:poly-gamma-glutamate capsule biosynthesis protein CapA/YwtB (metallophosphatase superfamily)
VGASAEAGDGVRLHNAEAGLAGLRAAGVRVVGIANNHSGDRGSEGPGQTARAIRSAEMSPVGLGAGHVVVEAAGKRVVVTAHDLDAALGADLPTELAAARAEGDVLVATFHVTGPPSYLPRPELREAVDDALAAGARVVAAHGTHVVGPVERRGDVVIAWGLGNLLFSCDCTRDIDGAILRVSLRGDQLDARIIPIDAGLDGAAAKPAHDAPLMLDLFEALGSSKLVRDEARGSASF